MYNYNDGEYQYGYTQPGGYTPPIPPTPPVKKNGKNKIIAVIVIVALAFAGGFGGTVAALNLAAAGKLPGLSPATADSGIGGITASNVNITTANSGLDTAEGIATKVIPSVVGISTVSQQTYDPFSSFGIFGFGGGGGTYDAKSVGTGVIVDEDGYILTNSHVVNDGETRSISVSLYDGSEKPGEVLWCDPALDLALVKIEATGLLAAELGDSDTIKLGSYSAAIGNPLGLDFQRSITQGIISGLDRTIEASGGNKVNVMEGLIQTDATINSGNSGGPLLNKYGQVIGINTAKASGGEGLSFAIPINVAKPIVESFKEKGFFQRPYMGISGIGLQESSYSDKQLKTEFGTTRGIYVSEVTPGGGAEKAGIKKGDIIIEFEGQNVGTMNSLNKLIIKYKVGDEVSVKVLRMGAEKTFKVSLSIGGMPASVPN